jgi:hypothetical protein
MAINKGVALLLERRKTNPKEFIDFGRWTNLLAMHNVYLDTPEAPIYKPRVFTKEVMRRLLTAYDLERKGGAISRAQLLKELLPGLNQIFDIEYEKRTEELKEKFNE